MVPPINSMLLKFEINSIKKQINSRLPKRTNKLS